LIGALVLAGCRPTPPLPTFGDVPPFELITATGARLDRSQLLGSPWIVDFVFSRCPGPCPRMGSQMKALGPLLPPGIRRISVSVDPSYDTPEVLARYAASFEATEPSWTFAVGSDATLQRLMVDGFKLGLARTPTDDPRALAEPITHSTRFALVDAKGTIRGYYDPFADDGIHQLARDARRLLEEP
jgi:protein SCO1/2